MSAGQVQAAGHGHAAAKVRKPGLWRILLPVAVAVAIALIPAPAGLAPHAWYYFAIFSAVIAGLVVERCPARRWR
jgi:L-tartrate/succinate antiporter